MKKKEEFADPKIIPLSKLQEVSIQKLVMELSEVTEYTAQQLLDQFILYMQIEEDFSAAMQRFRKEFCT